MSSRPGTNRNPSSRGPSSSLRRRARRPRNRSKRPFQLEPLEHRQLLSAVPPWPAASLTLEDFSSPAEIAALPTTAQANAPPIAADDAFTMAVNQQLGSGVLFNDSDPDGDPLIAILQSDPANGRLTLGSDGLFTYRPHDGFTGVDVFTYVAHDGQADSNVATVAITVTPVNRPPETRDDHFATDANQTLEVPAASGVLANDSDPDGDSLTAVLVDGPSHGQLSLDEDGSFTYIPDADFRGDDFFTYRASDGRRQSSLATVSLSVGATNDAPEAVDDAYATSEDQPLSVAAPGVLANDSDPNGDSLTAVLQSAPKNGTLVLGLDGSFEYVPNPDFHGTDGFTYVAHDGQADSAVTAVTITVEPVNDAPVAVEDTFTVNEDETLAVDAPGVLGNDSDVDGDPLTAVLVDGPAHGTLTLNPDGSFEYVPDPGFHGTDYFTYVANDGLVDSDPATVSVTVRRIDLMIRLEISAAPFGADVGGLWSGSTFWVNAYVQDLRDVPLGVVGGAIDVLYDATLVTAVGAPVYGEAFVAFQQGTVDEVSGLIDEAGALAVEAGVGADGFAAFVAWQFTAVAPESGEPIRFAADPGEGTATIAPANFALVGLGSLVDWSQVNLGSVDLALNLGDVNGDDLVNHLDLALWLPHAGSMLGDNNYDPACDLNGDARIDATDRDLLLLQMYSSDQPTSPSSQFAGDAWDEPDWLDDLLTGEAGRPSEDGDAVLAHDSLFAEPDWLI